MNISKIRKEDRYILHLLSDEKFTDHVIELFDEIYPDRNIFFIELKEGLDNLVFVKSRNNRIIISQFGAPLIRFQFSDLSVFSVVILHNIVNYYKIDLITRCSNNVRFHWMIWGADLYSFPGLSHNILPVSMNYLKSKSTFLKNLLRFIFDNYPYTYNILYVLIYLKKSPIYKALNACKKINSISTIVPTELELVRKYVNPNVVDIPFKYSTIEKLLSGDLETLCISGDFLVGNSATIENNHLDIFQTIKKLDYFNENIYCPLSYGGVDFNLYAQDIVFEGNKEFGTKFLPLTEYLSPLEYGDVLKKCGNVVMNHVRQQGLGNIVTSLWRGARVFLNPKSPIYLFFKSVGITIYTISDVAYYKNLPDYEYHANANRGILYDIYSEKVVKREASELVDILLK